MISIEKEEKIRSMLRNGASKHEISRKVCVSRGTIHTISKLPELRTRRRTLKISKLNKLKKPRRCSECGGLVKIWPCLLCNPETGEQNAE